MKIIHLITGLATGGAEMMLYKLLTTEPTAAATVCVISLTDSGTLGDRLKEIGVPVHWLGLRANWTAVQSMRQLRKIVREFRADIIQGWMYHGNFAALIASRLVTPHPPVIWNVRQSLYDLSREKLLTRFVIKLGAELSERPHCILYNSQISARQHEGHGYAAARRFVIPNGFDCARYKPNWVAREAIRKSLRVRDDMIIVGMVARYHPMKDHSNFLRAAHLLARLPVQLCFVMAGNQVVPSNRELAREITALGLKEAVRLLGERRNVEDIMCGFDIVVSASAWGEGFPNVIGEAMACEVPSVVTDVGDSAWVVGETGRIVPPNDPEAIATAVRELIELGPQKRKMLGRAARERVIDNFSLASIAKQYDTVYRQLINGHSPPPRT